MSNQIRYIPEWELDGPVLLALPHKNTDWSYILDEAIAQYRRLIGALLEGGEEVWLIVDDAQSAGSILADNNSQRIKVIEIPTNDTWTRDYGPIAVIRHDRLRAIDFGFNGWGLKFAADRDNLVNLNLYRQEFIGKNIYRNRRDFILEGGSIETDGKGTLLTTSRCLLSQNRNGGLSKSEATEHLKRELGAEHVLWLDFGGLIGDDTDSHIDTLCRLAPDNVILFTGCSNVHDPQYEELNRMRNQLKMFRNLEGEPYNLVELPLPDPIFDEEGNRLPATYANYLVTPNALYMPTYGQPENDFFACQVVKIAFPDHKVIPVDCTTLIRQHGSLHCSTMGLKLN